ncbi:cytochrome c oxidase subunit VA-domain-containing protein [Blastocladiella britannica]|nr:cytochrome c oxidase subunit VA-domain-containing protein [Blastocladiella britannica]
MFALTRTALRTTKLASLAAARPSMAVVARAYSAHSDEDLSFDDFTKKYVNFFEEASDLFEVQRGLNNCFSYDLVPSQQVVEAALQACRRVNDYPTAVRVFEGLKQKCPSESQYKQYLEATKPLREQLGVETRDELAI